jgi:hypothetical protein
MTHVIASRINKIDEKSESVTILLHLVAKDSFNHFGIRLVPTTKVFDRERHLDMSETVFA